MLLKVLKTRVVGEQQLKALAYELYRLTDEEIKIVEKGVKQRSSG